MIAANPAQLIAVHDSVAHVGQPPPPVSWDYFDVQSNRAPR